MAQPLPAGIRSNQAGAEGRWSVASAMKLIARSVCPPALWKLGHRLKARLDDPAPTALHRQFLGPFDSWDAAVAHSDGWDCEAITRKALASALMVRDGTVEFEQDTVTARKIVYSPAILAFLTLALARQRDPLALVDFGGGLATNFFQNRKILWNLDGTPISWNIVERPILVQLGRQHFARPGLAFFADLDEAARALGNLPDALMFSGSLQCLREPLATLDKVIAMGVKTLAFDRLIVAPESDDRVYVQCPDPELYYAATYPTWCFSKRRFIANLEGRGFRLVEDFPENPDAHFDHCGLVFIAE
jgi:putative methyltransferase (TIGR04325 family)